MKKILLFAATLSLAVLLASCDSASLTSRFESFIDKVEKKADFCTDSQWEKFDKEFSKLAEEAEKKIEELSEAEVEAISEFMDRYSELRFNSLSDDFWADEGGEADNEDDEADDDEADDDEADGDEIESLDDLKNEVNKALEGASEEVSKALGSASEEYNKALENASKELENALQGLF